MNSGCPGFTAKPKGDIIGHMTQRPPMPTEERKPAWRRACLAYREMRQAGRSDQEAHEAAVIAVLESLPGLPWKEASAEAVNAEPASPNA